MKSAILLFGLAFIFALLPSPTLSQTDDIRQATGLPIPIGQPVIYGQVTLRGLAKSDPKPSVFVTLLVGGAQTDRIQTNDRGYYYFLRSPTDGAMLVFEVNNNEVGRTVLTAGHGSSVRRDIEINWSGAKQEQAAPAVVSIKNDYPGRSPDATKDLNKAFVAKRAGNTEEATALFKAIVEKDSKDYVAWTELGSIYFNGGKLAEADTAYTKALELKPDFMPALMNYGKLQITQKQFDKAIVTLTKAIQTAPESADAFHYLGESYLQVKQGSRAVIALNEAIRLAPMEKAELHLRLATLYNAAGAKDRAANEYKLFLAKKPDYKEKAKLENYIKENS
ncbi:MAG TPA: tetratricopeptide repeat protein [Pyrinomonadaceae bacterium]|nr:tetratricopeptide repeat protein [Pyrinomonadaceae bacterium]